jgi:O-antigen/teichoic acid export membrane protein
VPSLIVMSVAELLLPLVAKALSDGDARVARRHLEGALWFTVIALAPITAFVFLTGNEVMMLLFSDAYATGGLYLGFLTASSALFSLAVLLGAALNGSGQSTVASLTLLAVGAVAVVLNLVLIPAYGPTGAATARMVSGLVAAGAMGVAAYRRFGDFLKIRTLLVAALATIVVVLVAAQFDVSGLLLLGYYGAGLTLYAVLLVVMRELRREHLTVVWGSLARPASSQHD